MSADDELRDLIPPGGVYSGEIRRVNTAARTCEVLIEQIDGGRHPHAPCAYTPHPTSGDPIHPTPGATCCVLEDQRGGYWIAQWRPA